MENWDSYFVEEIAKAPRVYDAKLKSVCELGACAFSIAARPFCPHDGTPVGADCSAKKRAAEVEVEEEEHEEL
jgi:hypothetical protein